MYEAEERIVIYASEYERETGETAHCETLDDYAGLMIFYVGYWKINA